MYNIPFSLHQPVGDKSVPATLTMTLIHSLCFAVQRLVYNLVSPVSFE